MLLFPDYRIVRFSISLSMLSHQKMIILHCFAIRSSMFKGDCLSVNNDDGHAFSSRYVTLCHASDTTLPLFDTSVTVPNMNNLRSDYNNVNMLKMSQSNVQIEKKHCLSSTRLVITCYTLNSRPCSGYGVSSRPEG